MSAFRDYSHTFEETVGLTDEELHEYQRANGQANNADAHSPSKFRGIDLDEIVLGKEPAWLVRDLLPATGLAVIYGLPKSGKSFLALDCLLHIAMGRSWAGREVLPGAVVYVTQEGTRGVERRLVAAREHYGLTGQNIPFRFIPKTPDFGHSSGDAVELAKEIGTWLDSRGNPPLRAFAIDTVARAMNGANESEAKDMTLFVNNMDHLSAAFACLGIGVHHAGKDITRGSRGSNALDAGADAMWFVEKGEAHTTATLEAMKDGEDGYEWTFRLHPHHFDASDDALSAASTCTVEILTEPRISESAAVSTPLPADAKLLLDIICNAIASTGEFVKETSVPTNVRTVTRDALRQAAKAGGFWDDGRTDDSNKTIFNRQLRGLRTRQHIGLTDKFVWLAKS